MQLHRIKYCITSSLTPLHNAPQHIVTQLPKNTTTATLSQDGENKLSNKNINDPEVKITIEDDAPDKENTFQKEKEDTKTTKVKNKPDTENMRITRSRTKQLLQETNNQQAQKPETLTFISKHIQECYTIHYKSSKTHIQQEVQ